MFNTGATRVGAGLLPAITVTKNSSEDAHSIRSRRDGHLGMRPELSGSTSAYLPLPLH